MAKCNVSSSHPDGEVGEVVEVGVGAGSAVEASVSSAMVQSLYGCTLTLQNKNSHQADCSGKGSCASAECLCVHHVSKKEAYADIANGGGKPLGVERCLGPNFRIMDIGSFEVGNFRISFLFIACIHDIWDGVLPKITLSNICPRNH